MRFAVAQRRTDMGWAARLTRALEAGRFLLHHQPYLALGPHSALWQHIEILLRLIDEDGKLVPPGSFLPAAERYNVMPAIDRWVMQTVFERHAELQTQLGAPLTCAINLSGTTLNADVTTEFIQQQALLHGIGASSLAYLKTLPVDYLKIDGSFVRSIATGAVDRALADTINRVGHIMGLQTVGEYAESAEVIAELRALGVDFAQGWGVARPQALPPRIAVSSVCEPAASSRASEPSVTKRKPSLTRA